MDPTLESLKTSQIKGATRDMMYFPLKAPAPQEVMVVQLFRISSAQAVSDLLNVNTNSLATPLSLSNALNGVGLCNISLALVLPAS